MRGNLAILEMNLNMQNEDYRNLDLDIPHQRLVNQRPWLIAGVFLVVVILVLAVAGYLLRKPTRTAPKPATSALSRAADRTIDSRKRMS
jgi:hypothetical protein